jgi:hypothetical protein
VVVTSLTYEPILLSTTLMIISSFVVCWYFVCCTSIFEFESVIDTALLTLVTEQKQLKNQVALAASMNLK